MKYKLSELVPVGINAPRLKGMLTGQLCLTLIISVIVYIFMLCDYVSELYFYDVNGKLCIYENVYMEDFSFLRSRAFGVFGIYAAFLVGVILYNFLYHYQGAKSIYTMKRLPDKNEYYRRCLALPVIYLLLLVSFITVFNFLYYLLYILIVPEQCLLPYWKTMWRF